MKKLPAPEAPNTGSSFGLVAGARFEAQQTSQACNSDVIELRFKVRGGTLVPAGA